MKAEISILSVPAVHAAERGRERLSLWHPSHVILPFLLFSSISFFRSHFPPLCLSSVSFSPFFFLFCLDPLLLLLLFVLPLPSLLRSLLSPSFPPPRLSTSPLLVFFHPPSYFSLPRLPPLSLALL